MVQVYWAVFATLVVLVLLQARVFQRGDFAVVINLDRNADRLAVFMARARTAGISIRRLAAVDGSTARLDDVDSKALVAMSSVQHNGFRTEAHQLTRGAVGCYLSHIRAWKSLVTSGKPLGYVFEDDAALSPGLGARVRDTVARLATLGIAWDMMLLGHFNTRGVPLAPGLLQARSFMLTHAYVMTSACARRLIRGMLPIRQQIDYALSEKCATGSLRVVALNPPLVFQDNSFKSQIQVPLRVQTFV